MEGSCAVRRCRSRLGRIRNVLVHPGKVQRSLPANKTPKYEHCALCRHMARSHNALDATRDVMTPYQARRDVLREGEEINHSRCSAASGAGGAVPLCIHSACCIDDEDVAEICNRPLGLLSRMRNCPLDEPPVCAWRPFGGDAWCWDGDIGRDVPGMPGVAFRPCA